MILRIDKAGRIVVPKPFRERLGLREGMDLEIEESSGELILRPAVFKPGVIEKQGLWIHQGVPERDMTNLREFIEEDREKRSHHLS